MTRVFSENHENETKETRNFEQVALENALESPRKESLSDSKIDLDGENLSKISPNSSTSSDSFGLNFTEILSGPFLIISQIKKLSYEWFGKNRQRLKWMGFGLLLIFFHVFLIAAIVHDFDRAQTLFMFTCIAWILVVYYKVVKRYFKHILYKRIITPMVDGYDRIWAVKHVRISFYCAIPILIAIFLCYDTRNDRNRLSGLIGMAFFILFMIIFSHNPSKIKWRPVCWGFFLQFLFGLAMLRWSWSRHKFEQAVDNIIIFLDYTYNGTDFVYGFLSTPPNICGMTPVIAFKYLQVLIFFGGVVSLLYYFGIMQVVFAKMAWFMQVSLKTTATESLYACCVIFLGYAEAPLLIKPYLEKMTKSELHAMMTSGLSCVAGSVFAVYMSFGACPEYLLAASVMSAPASLACSKLMYPETEKSTLERVEDLELPKPEEKNVIEAVSNGSVMAIELVAAIIANLIALMGLLAFVDNVFAYAGILVGQEGWGFQLAVGYLFYPLAYIMGANANPKETLNVAKLMGTKHSLIEFVAYQQLSQMLSTDPPELSPRSAMIATFALCSFANFVSVGIMVGILGSMAPSRKSTIAKLALRALLAGSISCFMTACLAGIIIENPTFCRPASNSGNCFDVERFHIIFNSTNFNNLTELITHSEL